MIFLPERKDKHISTNFHCLYTGWFPRTKNKSELVIIVADITVFMTAELHSQYRISLLQNAGEQ